MVLADIEIRAEINANRLIFDPPISAASGRIGSSSVDLLLPHELLVFPGSDSLGITITPSADGVDISDVINKLTTGHSMHGNPYKLEPGRLIIGKTLETVQLPHHIAGRIEGKSSLARLGLAVHVTAPTVLAGFSGRLYLEMHNVGPYPIELKENMQIAQLALERTGLPPSSPYGGQFQQQI